jgi:hypothetical protein
LALESFSQIFYENRSSNLKKSLVEQSAVDTDRGG